jgi:predicted anti-sigma-YlaC factor YlaD
MNPQETRLTACPEYIDRLVDLSDGEMTAGDRAAVQAHLASCAGCRAELHRLDASLVQLRQAIVPAASPASDARRGPKYKAALIAAGALAAAIALVIGVAAALKIRSGTNRDAIVDSGPPAPSPGPPEVPGPGEILSPGVPETAAPIRREDALRQIALLEQEARLATSLALLPEGELFAQERAANEQLLASFRRASALNQ